MARSGDMEVNGELTIPASDLVWRFGPSGGPGGQHANTANTRVELVFEFEPSETLSDHQRELLIDRFGPRLRVVADDARSQARNREVAQERMAERLRDALRPTRPRRATRPGKGAKERRLRDKRQRSQRKAERRYTDDE